MPKLSNARQTQAVGLPKFLAPSQASRVSGIGENKIRELMEKKELAYVQIGSHRRTTLEALDDWFEKHKVEGVEAEQAQSGRGA